MIDNLTIDHMRLIIDASFDSDSRTLLELNHPDLCIYLWDSVNLENMLQTVIEHDNKENKNGNSYMNDEHQQIY